MSAQKVDNLLHDLQQPAPPAPTTINPKTGKKQEEAKPDVYNPSQLVLRCKAITRSLKLSLHAGTEDVEQLARAYVTSLDAVALSEQEQQRASIDFTKK